MELKTIIWVFIIIFSLTAVITLLGITNVIKGIKENYLNKLFYTLIIEVVIAVVAVFKGVDFSNEGQTAPAILEQAGIEEEFKSDQEQVNFIVERLKLVEEFERIEIEIKVLKENNTVLVDSIGFLNSDIEKNSSKLNRMERSFYSRIEKLRTQINYYSGSINLDFEPEKKPEVFENLSHIFETLGYLKTGEKNNVKAIQRHYLTFELNNGNQDENTLIITEYETAALIREYLNKIYPVK